MNIKLIVIWVSAIWSISANSSIVLSATRAVEKTTTSDTHRPQPRRTHSSIDKCKLVAPDVLKKRVIGSRFNTGLSQHGRLIIAIYKDAYGYFNERRYGDSIELLIIAESLFNDLEKSGALWNPDRFNSKDDMKGYQLLFMETFRLHAKALLRLGNKDESVEFWGKAEDIKNATLGNCTEHGQVEH